MNKEQLKIIAEGMGYEVRPSLNPLLADRVVVWNGKDIHTRGIYNPLTNNDQMVEIMERIPLETKRDGDLHYARVIGTSIWFISKTLNEAVCNAAYEHFNNE